MPVLRPLCHHNVFANISDFWKHNVGVGTGAINTSLITVLRSQKTVCTRRDTMNEFLGFNKAAKEVNVKLSTAVAGAERQPLHPPANLRC